jgi:glutamate/tyrosine decarboxylase-like PLP-dependent enzyme
MDDLEALADLAQREGVWLHVDGAFGALAALSDALRPLVAGLARADSVAFDLHKWPQMPYDIGCVLVRDPVAHRRPFTTPATYLAGLERGIMAAAGEHTFFDRAPELSRRARAVSVWMLLKAHGVARYARLVEQNVAQARYLAALVERAPALELLAPVSLNVVCFRYAPPGLTAEARDGVNKEILMRLHERGIAAPSGTMVRGAFALRVAVVNHRSRREDFDLLAGAVEALGREVAGEAAG